MSVSQAVYLSAECFSCVSNPNWAFYIDRIDGLRYVNESSRPPLAPVSCIFDPMRFLFNFYDFLGEFFKRKKVTFNENSTDNTTDVYTCTYMLILKSSENQRLESYLKFEPLV